MASTGLGELIAAVRTVLIADATLARVGVFYGHALNEADLPYVLLTLVPLRNPKRFGPRDAFRWFQLQAKVCAEQNEDTGLSALATALPLKNKIYDLLATTIGGVSPQDRLSVALQPRGWRALTPLETGDIQPYADRIGDAERWHFGNLYDLRIQAIGT